MYSMFLAKLGQAYKPEKIRGMLKLVDISSGTDKGGRRWQIWCYDERQLD